MFEAFPKLTRFSHDWIVTEKIDGTNAQLLISSERQLDGPLAEVDGLFLFAGSRTRLLSPDEDNYGFAKWVQRNAAELVGLGEGRHFGEWCGLGINRNYALKEKQFALFNTGRWADSPDLPSCVTTVPVLASGYLDNPSAAFDSILRDLKQDGSHFSPGFMNPEGVVMFHRPSQTLFKKTFDYDEAGKWAENQARKEAA